MTTSRVEYLSPLNPVMRTFRIKQKNKRYMDVFNMYTGKLRKKIASFLYKGYTPKENPINSKELMGVGCSCI